MKVEEYGQASVWTRIARQLRPKRDYQRILIPLAADTHEEEQ